MVLYAKQYKKFYYNNYYEYKNIFDRYIDIWKNH